MKPAKFLLRALPIALALSAQAQAGTTLRASDTHPAGYPTVVAVESMGKKLEQATDGELEIRMYPGGVLGSEKEVIEQVQLGAIQLARVSLGVIGAVVPEVNVFNLPFIFRDEAHMRKVIDGEIGDEILAKVTNSSFNLVGLGWMDGGTRNLYTKQPVRSIADLKGMKIRMQNNPLFLDTMNAMGGNGISMDNGETFGALQTGVIDGAENNPPTMASHHHYQSAKYYSLTGHLMVPEMLIMSKRAWNRLDAEEQQAILKLAKEAQQEERVLWDQKVAESIATLKEAGVEFISVDREPFRAATAKIREQYGKDYAQLIERIESL